MSDEHHHHHHHVEPTTTILPNVTGMIVNAIVNTTAQMMAMAGSEHDDHGHHTTGGDEHPMTGGHEHHTTGHDGHGGHGETGDGMDHMMMMPMSFYVGIASNPILFDEWKVSTVGGMIGSVVGIFIIALLYEGLKFLREYLFREHFNAINYSSVAVVGQDGKQVTELHKITKNRIFGWPHLLQTSLHIAQVLVSYLLMLIFMTYNVWLCLAVLLGSGLGYFCFGWKKATVVDISEHCH